MKESINLTTMAADSSAALKKLAEDLRQLRRLIEMRALQTTPRRDVRKK